MPRWRAVVLDLDDTLYPEAAYVRSGFRAVAARAQETLGVPAAEGETELVALFEDGVRGDTFDRWLAARGLGGDVAVNDLVAAYRAHAPEIAPFPEAGALLRRLRADGSAVGLLSDGDPAVQGRKLDALGLRHAFDAIVVTGELGPDAGKPSPRGFEEVLRRLGDASPGEAVYVSDNPAKDFVGARRAGMRSIRVRRPGGIYAHLEPETPEHAPDAEVSGLDEVPSALESL
ncbi:MAG: putative hydrolase of the superfamily [Solirubrobacteraceae bacterium]|nr:putative hydrolase of the superfamily [Solirubrobacteraceae bacterium]